MARPQEPQTPERTLGGRGGIGNARRTTYELHDAFVADTDTEKQIICSTSKDLCRHEMYEGTRRGLVQDVLQDGGACACFAEVYVCVRARVCGVTQGNQMWRA